MTKGRFFLCSCFVRSQFLFESFHPTFCFGQPVEIRRVLNFLTFSSNVAFEEFVLRSLRASPYMEDSFFLEWFFLCRGSERGYCVIRD